MDLSGLSAAEQAAMNRIIEKKQLQDFMHLYAGLTDRCFNACVQDFTSKTLMSKEDTCVANCAAKFLKLSERVGQRFAEQNAETMNQQKRS